MSKTTTTKLWDTVVNETIKENGETEYVSNDDSLSRVIKEKARAAIKENIFTGLGIGQPLDDEMRVKIKGNDVTLDDKIIGTVTSTGYRDKNNGQFYPFDADKKARGDKELDFFSILYDIVEDLYLKKNNKTQGTAESVSYDSVTEEEFIYEYVAKNKDAFELALGHVDNGSSLSEWTQFVKSIIKEMNSIDDESVKLVAEAYSKSDNDTLIKHAKELRELFKELA